MNLANQLQINDSGLNMKVKSLQKALIKELDASHKEAGIYRLSTQADVAKESKMVGAR